MPTFTIQYGITTRSTGAHFVDTQAGLTQSMLAERLRELVSDKEYVRNLYFVTTQFAGEKA